VLSVAEVALGACIVVVALNSLDRTCSLVLAVAMAPGACTMVVALNSLDRMCSLVLATTSVARSVSEMGLLLLGWLTSS
jgi:hypothetical protein